jgi:hypothetical protein
MRFRLGHAVASHELREKLNGLRAFGLPGRGAHDRMTSSSEMAVRLEGFDAPDVTTGKSTPLGKVGQRRAAQSGAVAPENDPNDPGLARLLDAWPSLSPSDRAAIMAIIGKAP